MTGELTKAHGQFLKDVGTIHKESKAQYGVFADLAGVLGVINPHLSKNGLSVHQTFRFTDNNQHVLVTHLNHTSGEQLTSEILMPVNQGRNSLHDFGGAVTYCRRYSLLAILGLQAGIEDDDGDSFDEAPKQQRNWRDNPSASPDTHTQPKQEIPKALNADDRNSIIEDLRTLHGSSPKRFSTFSDAYKKHFPDCQIKISDHIQEPKHADFVNSWFIKNGPPSP
jgi:hypothetical protein